MHAQFLSRKAATLFQWLRSLSAFLQWAFFQPPAIVVASLISNPVSGVRSRVSGHRSGCSGVHWLKLVAWGLLQRWFSGQSLSGRPTPLTTPGCISHCHHSLTPVPPPVLRGYNNKSLLHSTTLAFIIFSLCLVHHLASCQSATSVPTCQILLLLQSSNRHVLIPPRS